MSRMRSVKLTVLFPVVFASAFGVVEAQESDFSVRVTPTDGQCQTDAFVVGYIGYKDLECNCVFSVSRDGPRRYHFRAEPVIGGIESGSPADGKLRPGDVVAAVDGSLITTREGGRRFSELAPGEPVTLTVRRRGTDIDVTLVPENACLEIGAVPPPRAPAPVVRPSATPRPPRGPVPNVAVGTPEPPTSPLATRAPPRRPTLVEAVRLRPTAPVPPPLPDASSGWVGFSIRCDECRHGEGDGVPVWEFTSPPEVDRVESHSPAHEAGLQPGDRLTHINGQSLTRAQGGRLFGAVEPGDTVVFRYTRNNSTAEAEIVGEERNALT
jgi:membrane-associated protease RseP (regulator of RpoE activity)